MAMGKNLAQHGVWGVTRHEFSSTSSSLIWPLLLAAAYRVLGTNELVPLGWNVLFGTLLLWAAHAYMLRSRLSSAAGLVALLGIVFLTPLTVLVVIGLEHTLHALLTLLVAGETARLLAEDAGAETMLPPAWLIALATLLVAARYEGLFLVGVQSLLFALLRRWRAAGALVVAGTLPVAMYGIVSIAHGWRFVPNSILIKGSVTLALKRIVQGGLFSLQGASGLADVLGYGAYARLRDAPHLLFLLVMACVLLAVRAVDGPSPWSPGTTLLMLFAPTSLLHVQFAAVGWLFRYEAYLVALGLLAISLALLEWASDCGWSSNLLRSAVVAVLSFFSVCALASRAIEAATKTPQATRNIYEQQYQMGLFLREHYQGATVTLSDVGAVNYLADIRCVDVDGLASKEPFDLKMAGAWGLDAIASLSSDSALGILYARVFATYGMPPGWMEVGSWTIPDNVICGDDTVHFYARAGAPSGDLATKLRRFGGRLPAEVRQHGYAVRESSDGSSTQVEKPESVM